MDANKMKGYKVVCAKEMARVEKISIVQGGSDEVYMRKAGENLAICVEEFIQKNHLERSVTLLVGRGNNGGDAFATGTCLLHKGYHVRAYPIALSNSATPLCQKQEKAFVASGGKVDRGRVRKFRGVILDGLLGTGTHGPLQKEFVEIIQQANHSMLPILAIDIPSGIDGNSGAIDPIAIKATKTLFLALPKLGCFLGEAYNFVGQLSCVDFGIDPRFLHMAEGNAYLLDEKALPTLPPLQRIRHKYEAGYVIGLAGSHEMPGAAMLSCLAALRSGGGIVRLFYPKGSHHFTPPPELICTPYAYDDPCKIFKEAKRAKSALIGPGLGRSEQMKDFIAGVVGRLHIPCVIDADGLFLVKKLPTRAVLTPHIQEMRTLLQTDSLNQEVCQKFVDQKRVTTVVKGAPTWIYYPNTLPLLVPIGNPGMATAGTGDVLTGIIAALLAQGMQEMESATLGVYLHGLAGDIAVQQKTAYSMIASDLIDTLPLAFQKLLTYNLKHADKSLL